MIRSRYPNIMMMSRSYDRKIEEAREPEGDHICTNLEQHAQPFNGAKEVVKEHKVRCWTEDDIRLDEMYNPVQ